MNFNTIPDAVEELKAGKLVIVVDDEDRENEGDLVMLAEEATAEAINFMAKYGRGLICMPMPAARLDKLKLHPMVSDHENTESTKCKFTVSVDAKRGTTTGISAHDRAVTIKTLIDPNTMPEDLAKPGHIFPLRAEDGGVLKRVGHTEATVDLARLAGAYPAGVLCEIMNEDGTMARVPDLMKFITKSPSGAKVLIAPREVPLKKKSILVVEDSITARMLLKNIFEAAGFAVKTAVDGVDAFAALRTAEFDIVVSDVDMPRMNGFDLVSKIRSDKKFAELPVVLVTGLESREDRERGIDVGANAYIVKSSFDQSNLIQVITRLI